MIDNNTAQMIINLYNDHTKHSNYQNIPEFISKEIDYKPCLNENWRGDTARLAFLEKYLIIREHDKVADIGANTGLFSLTFANSNPNANIFAYELNDNNCKFLSLIKDSFYINNLSVINEPVGLKELDKIPYYDIALYMNVIHHAGVDFDKEFVSSRFNFQEYAISYLCKMAKKIKILVFQMGYNWGGNKAEPIIQVNEIGKMIEFQKEILSKAGYQTIHCGIYNPEAKSYFDTDSAGSEVKMISNNSSEFYKRPLIIAKSNNYTK